MTTYVSTILEDLSEQYVGEATTPAASYLFKINGNCEKLDLQATMDFHHIVAQLLSYASVTVQTFKQQWHS